MFSVTVPRPVRRLGRFIRHLPSELRRLGRIHIDIPTIVVVCILILLAYRPLARWILVALGYIDDELQLPQWLTGFVQNVISDLVAALIVIPIVILVLNLRAKSQFVGVFDVYDVVDNIDTKWGEVDLTYNLTTNRVKGLLRHEDIELEIDAALEKQQYLRGHYVECSNLARRRLGAFLFAVDGDGKIYSGPYVYVGPDADRHMPHVGQAKWVRRD